MHVSDESIYAGIANLPDGIDFVEFGEGIALKPTYAHLMAPFTIAFAPAPAGSHHPPPWASVKGGLSVDIRAELHIPKSFAPPDFFDRLNTVWWITSLLRLALSPRIHVPVISNRAFDHVANDLEGAVFHPVEAFTHRYHGSLYEPANTSESLDWVVRTWKLAQHLMRNPRFGDTYQALDTIWRTPSSSLALLTLWGALENLFSPAKQELRFRVSANISTYLEPAGQSRLDLHKRLLKLYDARSSAAHGTSKDLDGALRDTQEIVRRVVHRILETLHVPTKEDLDALLFGAQST